MKTQQSRTSGNAGSVGVIIFLALLNALAPFSTDMYVPAFHALSVDQHMALPKIQLTLSSFFIGLCLGQLFWGPFSDRYGRKPVLLWGMVLYLVMTFLCTVPFSVEELMVVRFFQAIGGSACMVTAMAMVTDIFPLEKRTNIFTQLTIIMGLAPAVAPIIGNALLSWGGWRATFYGQFALGIIGLFGILFVLPSGHLADKEQAITVPAILHRYVSIVKNKQFRTYALVCSLGMGALFAYIGGFNFVIVSVEHQTESFFTLLFSICAFCIMLAGLLNRYLHHTYHADAITARTCTIMTVLAVLLVTAELLQLNFWIKYVLLLLTISCTGIIRPNAISLAFRPFSKESGSAAAMVGAMQFLIASFSSGLVSLLQTDNAIPIVTVLLGCVLWSGYFLIKASTAKREVL